MMAQDGLVIHRVRVESDTEWLRFVVCGGIAAGKVLQRTEFINL